MLQELYHLASSHRGVLMWASVSSLGMFVGSLLLVPWLVAHAPPDFFVREGASHRGARALAGKVARNLVGLVLLTAGIAMLFLPGQGLLVVLLAICLLDVPGKRALVRRIVQKPAVWGALSFLRERSGAPPFERPT